MFLLFHTRNVVFFLSCAIISTLFISCESDLIEQDIASDDSLAKDEYTITGEESLQIARNFFSSLEGNTAFARKSSNDIQESFTISDRNSEAALHINKIKGGGFVIVSADRRIQPILAFSDQNDFPRASATTLDGVRDWIQSRVAVVDSVREHNTKQSESVRRMWDDYLDSDKKSPKSSSSRTTSNQCGYDGQTYTETTYSSLLVQSRWEQGVGYNNSLTYLGCSGYSNGRPPAGCVAVATGMIMHYHQHPNWWNWSSSSMPNTGGSTNISNLLWRIGDEVDMDWKCSGSSANTGDAADALTGVFQYSSASYVNYAPTTVKNEINAGYPVILRGRTQNIGGSGHAWVCDGYHSTKYYTCEENPYTGEVFPRLMQTSLYLRMLWGWGTDFIGYYAVGNWNPGNSSYNYHRKMIVNIRP